MFDLDAPEDVPINLMVRAIIDALDHLRPAIEETLVYTGGSHTFDDVCKMVLTGRVRLWVADDHASFLITEVIDYPRFKVYHIWLGGGNLEALIAMHPRVQQVARDLGCTKLTIAGRKGWVRALKAHGWNDYATTLAKEV